MQMGTFSVAVEVENPLIEGQRRAIPLALVDTGSLLSWFPAPVLYSLGIEPRRHWDFRQADGTILTRWTGYAVVHVGDHHTIDEVVFAEESDMILLGARSLEGLNLRVDPVTMQLVDRGPAPAAAA